MRFMLGMHIGAQRYMDVYRHAGVCAEVCRVACRGMWRGAWRCIEEYTEVHGGGGVEAILSLLALLDIFLFVRKKLCC